MKIRYHLDTLPLLALLGTATAADGQVQPQLAQRYFEEATTLCERDAGRLWGVSLCGPMVVADPATRTRATSQPEPEAEPPFILGYADPAVRWGGLLWQTYPWNLLREANADTRQQLMLHGLFHRIQPELGLITLDGYNGHLDTLEGRVWLQLEWRALLRAVESSGTDRADAIADALAFRRERRRLFSGAADNERRDEIREGLAAYTGIAAWANSAGDAQGAAASRLASAASQPSFVKTFAYTSGPAYGVLLDNFLPGWRRQVRATSDLGDLLAPAADRQPTTDVAVAGARYDEAALRTAEEERDRAQQALVADLRRRYVDGPVLTMPAAGSATSDSTGAIVIPGVGTVFREYRLSAEWGRIDATGGALRSADGATLSVPATRPLEGTTLQGDGWSATLKSGWALQPAARPGSFTIVREN